MLLVKSCYTSQEIPVSADCEVILVEVLLRNQQKLLLSTFYRQPDHTTTQLENFGLSLSEVTSKSSNFNHCIISGGDFNLPDIDWNTNSVRDPSNKKAVHDMFLEILADHSLSQLVTDLTRENSILDLFLTNKPGLSKSTHVIPGLSRVFQIFTF